ncbi:MAG: hypothetical protein V3U72_02075 [Candidatus Aenigmarchaeota archaeon]
MKYIKKGISFLSAPGESLDNEKTTTFGDAFKYLLILGIIVSVLGAAVAVFWTNFAFSFIPSGSLPAEATLFTSAPVIFVTSLVGSYVGLVIGALIWGLWLHLWVYIVGARKGIEQTMKSVFYGCTPNYLLGWIPILNIIAAIWCFILTGMGMVKYQEMTGGKAAFAIIMALVIPVVIIGVLLATLLLPMLMTFGGLPAGTIPGL